MHDRVFDYFKANCVGKEMCRIDFNPSDWDDPECAFKLDSGWYEALYYARCELNPIMGITYTTYHVKR